MPTRKAAARQKRDLSSARIVTEALRLIDSKGLEGFSFRKLAQMLHCEAMSIYHWFPSKQHLFDAIVEHCIAEMQIPGIATPWNQRLRLIAHEFRNLALRHPGFFLYFGLYRMNSRAAMQLLNHLLLAFEETGLPQERQARLFRAIGYYITGAGLDEAMGYAKGPSAANPIPPEDVARDFPAVMRAGQFFGKEHHAETFRAGLEILMQQLEQEAQQAR